MTGAMRDALELIRSLKKQYPDETEDQLVSRFQKELEADRALKRAVMREVFNDLLQEFSYCDPKITSAVVEAYEAVWAVIQISEPVRDEKSDCERRAELSQKLASLVVDGVTDPAELRDRALASMSLETIKPANETLLPAS